ncbi:MAG TPA: hypothetical protein VGX68_00780 [Thermoanaerobaculia bacterium]|jgi:hypothetical protein|nr:hypothetical protein [Thermoanaerobaculia bacterium]
MNPRVLLMLAGSAAVVWSIRRWRLAIQVGMVLLIFEGALRKWVFQGSQDLVYFAKDVFFLGAYLGYLQELPHLRHRLIKLPAFYGVLILAAIFGLLQIFNPSLPNLLVGVFGFKAYFFYVPLLFIIPAAFPNDSAIYQFLRRYALLSIPVGLLAIAQFLSPASSILNTYARTNEEAYIATFGSSTFVRVTATFSFISGYTAYLLATAILILGLLGAGRWRFQGHLLILAALGMTLLGILMTGSRGPVLLLALLLPLYWWLAVIRERGGSTAFGRLMIALVLVTAFIVYAGEDMLSAFRGRAAGVSDVRGRLVAPFLSPYRLLPDAGFFGFGIGSTHQTAATLAPSLVPYSWLHGLIVEAETGRVMLELGALGFLLVYFLRVYFALFSFRQVFVLRTRFHRAMATAALLFSLIAIPGGIVFDVTLDVYYWFFAGLLMLMIRLDQEAIRTAARARITAPAETPGSLVPVPTVRETL